MDRREQIGLISWQTRNLSSFIAGGYMTDGDNPMIEVASTLAFDEIEKAQIEEAEQRSAKTPSQKSMFDENGDIVPVFKDPGSASFERFMGSMGNPTRWAGR